MSVPPQAIRVARLVEQMRANATCREMGRDPDAVEARNVYEQHANSFDWEGAADLIEQIKERLDDCRSRHDD